MGYWEESPETGNQYGGDHGEAAGFRSSCPADGGGSSYLRGEARHHCDEARSHAQGRGQYHQGSRHWESKTMNNEMEIETLDNNLKEARRIATDNEMKYDNLACSLAMMEDELKRAGERVKIAETRVVKIEEELGAIGENQKQLEVSEEEARRREEKYQEQIKQINIRLKQSESRSEYAEMNISKLHLRIDELEDEIIREKLKINAVSGQLDDTFNEMLNKY